MSSNFDIKFNSENFSYYSYFVVSEISGTNLYNVQLLLNLSRTNIYFSELNSDASDIRFLLNNDSNKSLHYYISNLDITNEILNIWVLLPFIKANTTEYIYIYYGNQHALSRSSINSMGFIYAYVFNGSPLSYLNYSGNINEISLVDGYKMGNSGKYITSVDSPLLGYTSWELFFSTKVFNYSYPLYIDDGYTYKIKLFNNDFDYNVKYISEDMLYSDYYGNIIGSQFGYESDGVYNLNYIAYTEDNDIFKIGLFNRLTYNDYLLSVEKNSEGNFRPNNFSLYGPYRHNNVYICVNDIIIRNNIDGKLNIDTSTLSANYNDNVIILDNLDKDLTNPEYKHTSDCGGNPINLSIDSEGSIYSSWQGVVDPTGSIIVDTTIKGDSKIVSGFTHYCDDNIYMYYAARLSEGEHNGYDSWRSNYKSSYACIDFEDSACAISSLSLKAHPNHINGMIKDFVFYGGVNSPIDSESEWIELYSGTCTATSDWQVFNFNNKNKYRYYKLNVLNTHGSNIVLKEWDMYEGIDGNNNGVILNKIALLPLKCNSYDKNFPKSFELWGTKDYITWTLLSSRHTYSPYYESTYGYWQYFYFNNSLKYQAYKLSLQDNWEGSSSLVIDKWKLLQSYYMSNVYNILHSDTPFLNIFVEETSGFDDGWILVSNSSVLFYLYDNYVARSIEIGSISDFIL